MNQKKIKLLMAIFFAFMLFQYCTKDHGVGTVATTTPHLPANPFNYTASFPQHIAQALGVADNTPADNPITNDGATLGRVLFYDKIVSGNKTISCASCHKQDLSFADNTARSLGFKGGMTRRNSMPTIDLRFYHSGKMFWDERAATLEQQVLMPIQDTTEMGMTLTELVSRVSSTSYYSQLFKNAFGTSEINSDRISKALAQFLRSIVTYQSKYDRVKEGLDVFTSDEQSGEQLFLTAGPVPCAGCHRPPMFLTSDPAGPFALQDPNDHGINNENRFKVGSLRNISSTAPYFHNGSISSMVTLLASNIPAHGIAPQDRPKILAFLNSLTDNTITTEAKFSDPFK